MGPNLNFCILAPLPENAAFGGCPCLTPYRLLSVGYTGEPFVSNWSIMDPKHHTRNKNPFYIQVFTHRCSEFLILSNFWSVYICREFTNIWMISGTPKVESKTTKVPRHRHLQPVAMEIKHLRSSKGTKTKSSHNGWRYFLFPWFLPP